MGVFFVYVGLSEWFGLVNLILHMKVRIPHRALYSGV